MGEVYNYNGEYTYAYVPKKVKQKNQSLIANSVVTADVAAMTGQTMGIGLCMGVVAGGYFNSICQFALHAK